MPGIGSGESPTGAWRRPFPACSATTFALLDLGDQYATAPTTMVRARFLATREAVIAADMWHSHSAGPDGDPHGHARRRQAGPSHLHRGRHALRRRHGHAQEDRAAFGGFRVTDGDHLAEELAGPIEVEDALGGRAGNIDTRFLHRTHRVRIERARLQAGAHGLEVSAEKRVEPGLCHLAAGAVVRAKKEHLSFGQRVERHDDGVGDRRAGGWIAFGSAIDSTSDKMLARYLGTSGVRLTRENRLPDTEYLVCLCTRWKEKMMITVDRAYRWKGKRDQTIGLQGPCAAG